ncbi:unnamed protein product [Calypogeia fissa]
MRTMCRVLLVFLVLDTMLCLQLCRAVLSGQVVFPHTVANVPLNDLDTNGTSLIPSVCQATIYPDLCTSSLSADNRSATAPSSAELVRIAIDLGCSNEQESITLIQNLVSSTPLDVNSTSAAFVCEESLGYGSVRLSTSRDSLLVKPIQDIQAWLSAALQFQYDCFSALSNLPNPPADVTSVILPQMNSTMQLVSNALCMTDALAFYGDAPSGWLPPAETRPADISTLLNYVSPEWQGLGIDLQSSTVSDIVPNVTVSQDGLSNYLTVQEAVDNAPSYGERYVIYIKAGIYSEPIRVEQDKPRITFVGDGVGITVLTGNNNAAQPGTATYQTASVVVVGDGFIAMGITFQNTAGPYATQAVAIRVDSDFSIFQGCSFDGYQDTLYTHTGRQFYINCNITGTLDFIFGNSAAVFQNCQLVVRSNRPGPVTSTVTAQGRTDPGQTTGLVFQNCTVTSSADYVEAGHQAFLGRPWKLFSRTIYLNTFMDSLISSAGWYPWSGDFALDSLLYGEYGSYGPGGADVSSRVSWSNQLTGAEATYFSTDNFIQGGWWIPVSSSTSLSATFRL